MVINKKMNKLGEWATGKPLGLIIIAQQAAAGAEACFEFLKLIKAGERNVIPDQRVAYPLLKTRF
jgi:hypothetical protein